MPFDLDCPDDLDAALDTLLSVRDAAAKDAAFGQEDPWPLFIRKMRLLSAQSYGGRIERYLISHFGWEKVPQADDRGDAVDGDGRYWEIKVSVMYRPDGAVANFVQLRPWQDIDGYQLFVVDVDNRVWRFVLTPEQMADEVDRFGGYAHGTADVGDGNERAEMAVRLPWREDNDHWLRWVDRYLVDSDVADAVPARSPSQESLL